MTIEATLLSIDATLKALLASVQAGAQMAAEFSGAEPGASRKRRTKAEIAADEAAAAAAKQAAEKPAAEPTYYVNYDTSEVYVQQPGAPKPEGEHFVAHDKATYEVEKANFEKAAAAKNAQGAVTTPATAHTEPSATAQPATASAATSASDEVTWDAAVTALKTLAQNPAHGSTAVMAVIKQIDPAAANVPALKPLGKNAEIVAAVDALLNPKAATAEADPLFG